MSQEGSKHYRNVTECLGSLSEASRRRFYDFLKVYGLVNRDHLPILSYKQSFTDGGENAKTSNPQKNWEVVPVDKTVYFQKIIKTFPKRFGYTS